MRRATFLMVQAYHQIARKVPAKTRESPHIAGPPFVTNERFVRKADIGSRVAQLLRVRRHTVAAEMPIRSPMAAIE